MNKVMGMSTIIDQELSRLPQQQSASVVKAQAKYPDTVVAESSPSQFIRYCNDKTLNAASMLASFWNIRLALFGEKAFMPLFEVSKGAFGQAVSTEDLGNLESSCVQVLSREDSNQRHMIVIDSVNPVSSSLEALKRVTFLILQSLIMDVAVAVENAEVVVLVTFDKTVDRRLVDLLRWVCGILTWAIPVGLARLHLIQIGKNELPSSLFPFVDQLVRENLVEEVVFTKPSDVAQLLLKLAEYGIGRATLPPLLGGESRWESKRLLDMACPKKLQMTRVKKMEEDSEKQDLISPRGLESPIVVAATTTVVKESSEDTRQGSVMSVSDSLDYTDTSTAARPRTKNAIYSRRKYLRKKIEFEVLENECKRLHTNNADLKQEGKRLEELLQKALHEVQRQATPTTNSATGLHNRVFPPDLNTIMEELPLGYPTTGRYQQMLNDPGLLFGLSQSNLHSLAAQSASTNPSFLDPGNLAHLSPILAIQLQGQARHRLGALSLPQAPGVNERELLSESLSHTTPVSHGPPPNFVGTGVPGRQPTEGDIQRFLLEQLRETQNKRRF